jgi:hypothetical protein
VTDYPPRKYVYLCMTPAAEIMSWVDRVLALPRFDPALVSTTFGVALTITESNAGYVRYAAEIGGGPFSRIEMGHRAQTTVGTMRLFPRVQVPSFELQLSRFGALPIFSINPSHPPDGVTHHTFWLHGDTVSIAFSFAAGGDLISVTITWGPKSVRLGDEAVFAAASANIYLTSYDIYDEVLEYAVATRTSRVISRSDFERTGRERTQGSFVREGNQVAGVFATPEGPAFFHDQKRVLGIFGRTKGRIDPIARPAHFRFSLNHHGTTRIDVVYAERHGIGTNPYDNEQSDVDLFAMMTKGTKNAQFFFAYTKPWA